MENRSPDQIELDELHELREARGRALRLVPAELGLVEVLELGKQIGDTVDGKNKHLVTLALLSTYYLALLPPEKVNMKDLLWFIEEGTFQLGSMLAARLEQKGTIQ